MVLSPVYCLEVVLYMIGMKFTKIYVFLGFHQTFKLEKNTICK